MSARSRILVRNVYYVLAYAFQGLNTQQFQEVATEPFEHIHDLFAAILAKGISRQLKQGIHREYRSHADDLATLRGKVDIPGTVRLRAVSRPALACEFGELTENNQLNQILKATARVLIRHGEVWPAHRSALQREMLYFSAVDDVELSSTRWSAIRFARHNRSYRMLIGICQLVAQSMLLTDERGQQRLMSFLDDQAMSRLYERFLLHYYVAHWPALHPRSAEIAWALEEGEAALLPSMRSDITLSHGSEVLIIDAKYYQRNTQVHFNRHTVHSGNLYQIFTYVHNRQMADAGARVAGMLLYARTSDSVQPDAWWRISGSNIAVRTLDLGREFADIAAQLDGIAREYFPQCAGKRG